MFDSTLDVALQRRLRRRRHRQGHPTERANAVRISELEREPFVAQRKALLHDHRAQHLLRGHRFAPRHGLASPVEEVDVDELQRHRQRVEHAAHRRELACTHVVARDRDKAQLLG